MPTATETLDFTEINQQNFNNLAGSIGDYELTPENINELRAFFDVGATRLRDRVPAQNYQDELSYATGQLLNKFAFSTPAQMRAFDSFTDFLRSFCPLDPFC